MVSEILKICGVAVLCAIVGVVLSGVNSFGISAAIKIGGFALCIGGVCVLLGEAADMVLDMAGAGDASEYATLMIRGLGICVLCRICSDICRDSGHAALSGAVETAGKLALILMALPVVGDIIEFANELIERM